MEAIIDDWKKPRVAAFITCIGPDAIETYNGLAFENEGDNQDIEKVID